MMYSCEDFIPLTYNTYGAAGCYGCENARLNIDFVSCAKEHWCIPMLVPVMENDSDSFFCSEHKPKTEHNMSLCEDCYFWNSERNYCKLGKELKEIVVRIS